MNVIIVILMVCLLVYIISSEQPIWLGLTASGLLGIYLLGGGHRMVATISDLAYTTTTKYTYLIIPMFILMGIAASKADLADDAYKIAAKITNKIPGGLGIATILACGGFAAVTGSSVATVATLGKISVNQMKKHGYLASAAAAVVACGGTLGVLIPPSIILVIYGILTGESIGKLLLAGVIPGVLSIVSYSITIYVSYKVGFFNIKNNRQNYDNKTENNTHESSISFSNIVGVFYIGLLFFVVIGGLYTGFFTATESGAVAAAVALVVLLIRNFKKLNDLFALLKSTVIETAQLSSMIFALMIGGSIFSVFLVSSRVPLSLVELILDVQLPVLSVLLIILGIMLILGCLLDSISILVITIPLAYPIMHALGFDGIVLAILVVKVIEIGLVTPPVGLNVYVVSATTDNLQPSAVFAKIWPLVFADLVVIGLLIMFPSITLWLPDLVYG